MGKSLNLEEYLSDNWNDEEQIKRNCAVIDLCLTTLEHIIEDKSKLYQLSLLSDSFNTFLETLDLKFEDS